MGSRYPTLNPSKGARYFFFTSLESEADPEARQLAYNVKSLLASKNSLFSHSENQESNGESNIKQALNFLENAYKREQMSEYRIFKQKIQPQFKGTKYEKIAKDVFEEDGKNIGSVDYIGFMNLLKIIEDGEEEWKQSLSELKEDVQATDTALKNLFEEISSNEKERLLENPGLLLGKLFKRGYADQQKLNVDYLAMERLHRITQIFHGSIRSDAFQQIVSIIVGNGRQIVNSLTDENNSDNKTRLTQNQEDALLAELNRELVKIARRDLAKTNAETINNEAILRWLQTELEKEEKNEGNISKKMEELVLKLLRDIESLEEQGEAMNRKVKGSISVSEKGSIVGITAKNKDAIAELLEIEKLDNARSSKQRKAFLENIRQALIDKHYISETATKEEEVEILNEIATKYADFSLSDESEHLASRGLKKIFSGQAGSVLGRDLGKTDTVTISLGNLVLNINLNVDELLKEYKNLYSKSYQEERTKISRTIQEQIGKTEAFSRRTSFSIEAETKAVKKAQDELKKKIEQEIKNSSEITDKTEALRDFFIIDDSVKQYRFTHSFGAFHGGSLGADIFEQVQNICEIYELGGITPIDRDWLIFAVINCGQGMLGGSLNIRSPLEDYFSIVASLLMFNTGGLLAEQVKNQTDTNSSITNIHIFTFDRVYVPLSYILKETWDALNVFYSDIEGNRTALKSQAKIVNNVTKELYDKMKEDKKELEDRKKPYYWKEVFKEGQKEVSINIQLLAGFLDLLEQLEEQLNNLR